MGSSFENEGDFLIDSDQEGVWIEIYFGDQFQKAEEELTKNYSDYAKFFESLFDGTRLTPSIMTIEEKQVVSFHFQKNTRRFKSGGSVSKVKYNTPMRAEPGDKHKMKVYVKHNGKVKLVRFGLRGMEDYTQHKDKERRKNYLTRSEGIVNGEGKKTKDDPFSANYWSRRILWDSGEAIVKPV